MRALPRPAATMAIGVAVLAAGVLVVGDVGGGGGPTGREPTGPAAPASVAPPTDPGVDYRDPTAVCLRFADAIYRRDARTDSSAQAAYRRAMAYATGELAATVAAQPDGRDRQWANWRAHHAAANPTVTAAVPDGDVQPADTAGESYRVADVSYTPVGVDGWRGPVQRHVVLCTLRRDGDLWRVERYQVHDEADAP